MPTRRIDDENDWCKLDNVCRDPEHNPPNMMVFQPGLYEHECPRCKQKMYFTIPKRINLTTNINFSC